MTAELIARLESADGPDRELFMLAYAACFPALRFDGHPQRFMAMLDAEAWTSAAEMLVPEGWQAVTLSLGHATVMHPEERKHDCQAGGNCAGTALAAAALKARGV